MRDWQTRRRRKQERMRSVVKIMTGPFVDEGRVVDLLESVIQPGDRVAIEGDNQMEGDFLAKSVAAVDPEKIHDIHLMISSISLPKHLHVFEKGIRKKLDFAYADAQSVRMAEMVSAGTVDVDAIQTYIDVRGVAPAISGEDLADLVGHTQRLRNGAEVPPNEAVA